jgi:hypothetical protein
MTLAGKTVYPYGSTDTNFDPPQFSIDSVSREPQKKKTQVRLDYSPAPTQLALLSPICFPRSKGPIAATRVTLDDS